MHPSLRSSSMRHGEVKIQSRNTPGFLADAARAALGGRVDLDPCANESSVVGAATEIFLQSNVPKKRRPTCIVVGDGLGFRWRLYGNDGRCKVFVNPPWDDLKHWLAAMAVNAADGCDVVALVPLRPHRVYWKPAWSAKAICFLDACAFEGFDNKMPTPCVMLYWGNDVEQFRRSMEPQGRVLTLSGAQSTIGRMTPDNTTREPEDPITRMLAGLIATASDDTEMLEIVTDVSVGCSIGDLLYVADEVKKFDRGAGDRLEQAVLGITIGSVAVTGEKQKPAKKKAPPNGAKAKATKAGADTDIDKQVVAVLRKNKDGLKIGEIMTHLGVNSRSTMLRALNRLVDAKRATKSGQKRGVRYMVA